jgi:hypothetical protein
MVHQHGAPTVAALPILFIIKPERTGLAVCTFPECESLASATPPPWALPM